MSDKTSNIINSIINIQNPEPILQQKKAKITTNPFIKEKIYTDDPSDSFFKKQFLKINKINKKISTSFFSFLNESYKKPDNLNWTTHITYCFNKNDRYIYLILLFFYIIIILVIINLILGNF